MPESITDEEWTKTQQCRKKGRVFCFATPGCTWNKRFRICEMKETNGGSLGKAGTQLKIKYNNKSRKVNVDKEGHRYIRMNGEILYLKTIRGQYRYIN